MKQKQHPHWLKNALTRVCKVHIIIIIAYIIQLIAYDAAKSVTPEVLRDRWFVTAGLTAVVAAVYYLTRMQSANTIQYKFLTWLLILSDIAFAAYNVYTQRGMASRAVLLFIIPIVVASILVNRAALFATAILCVAVYTATAVAYFVNFFNEGYKIELYGEILFYSATFIAIAGLLWASLKAKHNR